MKSYLLLSIVALFIITTSFCQGQNPVLYGMAQEGGNYGSLYGDGVLFSYNTGGTETVLHNFGTPSTDGVWLYGSLIQASNGLLYGMTFGGLTASGVIFSYDVSTGTEKVLYGLESGSNPEGSLIQASNGLLYGMTHEGGVNGKGNIFSYDYSTNSYTDIHDFDSTNGGWPRGSLVQASNGVLYGMASGGGADSGRGVLFSYDITSSTYAVIYNFGNGTDGWNPWGSLIQASNGLLYGMTYQGGTNFYGPTYLNESEGTLFSYDITSSTETVLHDFGSGSTDGVWPTSSLIQASNGLLYGMTPQNGVGGNGNGIMFSYDITSSTYTDIYNFAGGYTDGFDPQGSLMQASNGLLYGMTEHGGQADSGIIFSYDITSSIETDVHDFINSDGAGPLYGSLIEYVATGINPLSINNDNLSIYPNPSSGQFTIKLLNNQNDYSIEVYNVMGEKIYQSILNNSQNCINLNTQPSGLYFVYLKSGEGIEVGKILVTN